jgi:hypothetical protein
MTSEREVVVDEGRWGVVSIQQEAGVMGRRVTIELGAGYGPSHDGNDLAVIGSVPDGAWEELARLASKRLVPPLGGQGPGPEEVEGSGG